MMISVFVMETPERCESCPFHTKYNSCIASERLCERSEDELRADFCPLIDIFTEGEKNDEMEN